MSTAVMICMVIAIADGDTLTARCGSPGAYEQVKVRLSAIDAPEKAQPFGQKSWLALAALCHEQQATITPVKTDRYGRTVADVICRGKDAGQEQVRTGMAWVFDKYAKGYSHLYPVQEAAKSAKAGLWAQPDAMPPWEWRSSHRGKHAQEGTS